MEADLKNALAGYLLGLADDELLLGHRDSEWCGYAPILEEDIAFANLALDELGHASLWYRLVSELLGKDPEIYPDQLVFFRPPSEFRNIQMVELPNGDWAFSIARQYFFDSAELVRLKALAESPAEPVAVIAAKIRKEEAYHHRHSQVWMERLGPGTDESHHRLQKAVNELWPFTEQLFEIELEAEELLVQAGVIPTSQDLRRAWLDQVLSLLETCQIEFSWQDLKISRYEHTASLNVLLGEMQSVARLDPEAAW